MKICFLLEKMADGSRDQHCERKHSHTSERGIWNRTILGEVVSR